MLVRNCSSCLGVRLLGRFRESISSSLLSALAVLTSFDSNRTATNGTASSPRRPPSHTSSPVSLTDPDNSGSSRSRTRRTTAKSPSQTSNAPSMLCLRRPSQQGESSSRRSRKGSRLRSCSPSRERHRTRSRTRGVTERGSTQRCWKHMYVFLSHSHSSQTSLPSSN